MALLCEAFSPARPHFLSPLCELHSSTTNQPPTNHQLPAFPFALHHPSIFQARTHRPSPGLFSDPTWASTSRLCSGRDALSVHSSLPGPHKRAGQQNRSRVYLGPRWSEGPKRAPFKVGLLAGALFHSKRSILLSLPSYILPTVVHRSSAVLTLVALLSPLSID